MENRDLTDLEKRVNDTVAGFASCLETLAQEVVIGPQEAMTARGTRYTTYGLGVVQEEGTPSFVMPVDCEDNVFMRRLVVQLEPLFGLLSRRLVTHPRLVWRLKPMVYCRGPNTQEEIDTFQLTRIFTTPMFWMRMRLAMETLTQ